MYETFFFFFREHRSRCSNWGTWRFSYPCTIVGGAEWVERDERWSAGFLWVWTAPDLRSCSIGMTCERRGNRRKYNAGTRCCVLEAFSSASFWIYSRCSHSSAKPISPILAATSMGNRCAFLRKNNCSWLNLERDFGILFLLISRRHTVYCLVE